VGQTLSANTGSLGGNGIISYQWKRGTTGIGTNSSTYVVQSADAGFTITVTVTRTGYTGSVTSQAIGPINVAPGITITTQPAAATSVTAGSISGSLSVAASVSPSTALSYHWYSNTSDSNTGGSAIDGATSENFTIPVTLTAGTYYYFCEVRATGADSVRSNVATVTVVTAAGRATVTLTFAQISDIPDINGPTVSRSASPPQAIITLADPGQYSEIKWYITGSNITGTESPIVVNLTTYPGINILGQHFLTVEVTKAGKPYNKTVVFTVAP